MDHLLKHRVQLRSKGQRNVIFPVDYTYRAKASSLRSSSPRFRKGHLPGKGEVRAGDPPGQPLHAMRSTRQPVPGKKAAAAAAGRHRAGPRHVPAPRAEPPGSRRNKNKREEVGGSPGSSPRSLPSGTGRARRPEEAGRDAAPTAPAQAASYLML